MRLICRILIVCALLAPGVRAQELGNYQNATTPLSGLERLIGDQNGQTVNITPFMLQGYIFPGGLLGVPGGGSGVGSLTGLVRGNGTSPFSAAAASDVYNLFGSAGSGSCFLAGNGTCVAAAGTGTVTTTGSPDVADLAAFSGASSITAATAAQVVALFTGCSGTEYLGADGACHTGTGTVTTTGSPGSANIAAFSSATSITAATSGNVLSLWSGTCDNTTFMRGDGSCQVVTGTGTVTSVNATAPSWLNVGGVPFTTSGTIAITSALQTSNLFLGSPDGSGGVLAPRSIHLGDLPLIPLNSQVSSILPAVNGGSGVATLTGIAKGNGTSPFTAAASTDVLALWTGSCSSSTFMRGDGACAAPAGSGTVTTTGSPANAQLAAFSGASSITTAVITGDMTCSGLACTVGSIGGNAVTLGGALTTSGAHSVVLTTTGPTNVTLPTSGTLITNSVASLSSLVTVGTIATGTWDGSIVQPTYGGTGVNNGSNTITVNQPSTFTSATGNVAPRELDQVAVSTTHTFLATDDGDHLYHSGVGAAPWTGPTNSVDALPLGAIVTVVNAPNGGLITITPGDTLLVAGTSTSICPSGCTATTLTVAANGVLTLLKTGATQWSVGVGPALSGITGLLYDNAGVLSQATAANVAAPLILMQSGIPFILSSSGGVGNNCAITGLTAMQTTYSTGAYIWMKAGAIASGSTAGWYDYVASSTTAGTCYNDSATVINGVVTTVAGPYTSGQPAVPASHTAFSTTGPGAFTQTTGAYIVGPTISVPAASMGVNGELQFDGDATVPATANGKQIGYKFGASANEGIAYFSTTATTTFGWLQRLRNRGVATAQFSSGAANQGEPASGTAGPNYLAINTASAQNFLYEMQLTTATDYIVLESYTVKELASTP